MFWTECVDKFYVIDLCNDFADDNIFYYRILGFLLFRS